MTRWLVLFDIDGTLMITKGAGSRCLRHAGKQVFGDGFEWAQVTVGTLDPQIFRELAKHNGVKDPGASAQQFADAYLAQLEAELARIGDDITIMPGIVSLLETLESRTGPAGDITLGLLTGNFAKAAELKLDAANLRKERFVVNAFAEDGQTRNDLPAVAMQRYEQVHGEPALRARVVVIGDTPRDVACAHAHGCVAVAVATGRYGLDQLRAAEPDLLLPDLADPAPLLELLDSPLG